MTELDIMSAPNEPQFTAAWLDRISSLANRDGGMCCHYCRRIVHISKPLAQWRADDATIDHKIPKSKCGTDALENLLLACRACNEAKEDRSYEDFLARPYRLTPVQRRQQAMLSDPAVQAVLARFPGSQVVAVRERKPIRGTLAYAIQQGEVDEAGRYRKPSSGGAISEPAPRMSALKTAQWLRESAEKKGKQWPRA
jgi:hypothetical protein